MVKRVYQGPYFDATEASACHRRSGLARRMRWIVGVIIIASLWLYGIWLMWTDGRTKAPSFAIFKRHVLYVFKFSKLRASSKMVWKDTKHAVKTVFKPDKHSHGGSKKAAERKKSVEKQIKRQQEIDKARLEGQKSLHANTGAQAQVGGK